MKKSSTFERYHDSVSYLETLSRLPQPDYFTKHSGRSFFLRRFEHFLKVIGNPERGMRYIHIGGTSGKGSVAIMIQAGLSAAGHKTGLYLSPHPTTTIERIKIGNLYISPKEFSDITDELKPSIDGMYRHSPYGRPSYFEIITAVAFIYFKRQHCKYVVLEVGLGGRYDATNVISAPLITVINRIGLDHTEVLGNTLTKIAKEKAAIIKRNTVFFSSKNNPRHIIKLLERTCAHRNVPCNIIGAPTRPYRLRLLGKHQQFNAELSAAVLKHLGVDDRTIRRSLASIAIPCRIEIIRKNPTVILDGAHNVTKMQSVADAIRDLTHRRVYLIIALTKKRNPKEVFKNITRLADHVIVTYFQSSEQRCAAPLDVVEKIQTKHRAEIFLDAAQALDHALALAGPKDMIIVTGSFYLAGELRKRWRSETKILTERIS